LSECKLSDGTPYLYKGWLIWWRIQVWVCLINTPNLFQKK
jgi:hypothetical protein